MHPVLKNIFISFVAADHPATDTAAAPVHQPAGAAADPFSDGEDVPAKMQGSNDCGLARDDVKPGDTMQESRPAHLATAPSEIDHFKLDVDAFMDEIEEPPLFLQRAAE